jgi:type IX secretion system PorP/SprF family membrane protein
MKKYILCCVCLVFSLSLFSLPKAKAQQNPIYTQYMFNHLAINPAYAGNQKQLFVTGLYRNQWENFKDAPETITFSAHSALRNRNMGLGMLTVQDQVGVHNYTNFYMSYAYQIRFPGALLAMGLQAGFTSINSNYDKLDTYTPTDPTLQGIVNRFAPNFGTGLFFSTKDAYAGISIPMLIENEFISDSTLTKMDMDNRFYFVTAGKVFNVSEHLKVKPSTLISFRKGTPVHFDLNMNFILQDVLNLGTSYRHNDALVFLMQLQVSKNFAFGYSYDYVLSDISSTANASHEIMLNYRINLTRQICHTYF